MDYKFTTSWPRFSTSARLRACAATITIFLSVTPCIGSDVISDPAKVDSVGQLESAVPNIGRSGLALPGVLFAQAGGAGGSITPPTISGRVGKSIAGGSEPEVRAPSSSAKKKRSTNARKQQPAEQAKAGARFNAFIGSSASRSYLACTKNMGGRENCSEPQGGCNEEGRSGVIAVGLLQGVGLGVTTNHNAISIKAAESSALERCNALVSKYGIECKIVHTWSAGCGYVTRGCAGPACRRNLPTE